jgi:hypothetical protein
MYVYGPKRNFAARKAKGERTKEEKEKLCSGCDDVMRTRSFPQKQQSCDAERAKKQATTRSNRKYSFV